ncbi:MAG TPA: S8 family serine peptidase [Pyrinomonadaceae bacterium]|nr:S8 family serine peptidase [Pyrinomonadaceae bacterium]
MNNRLYRRSFSIALTFVLSAFLYSASGAAALSPTLRSKLPSLTGSQSVGVVIIAFNTPASGLSLTNLNLLRSVGILKGVTFQKLGMVGAVATAGQVRALQNNSSVKSIWSNDHLQYLLNHARLVTGVDRLRLDQNFTNLNFGQRVSGAGDFSVLLIDSGIDATGNDLPYGSKVIQNTQRAVDSDATNTGINLAGSPIPTGSFLPAISLENIPDTDNVGHGTHCAGIIGGLGVNSAGSYAGVAPGVKIVGSGGGAVILVLSALAGWEYAFTHADLYKIRVVSNSYGPLGGGTFDPNDPLMIAAKRAHDDYNMTVVFAAGNDGPAKGTLSPYSQAPWVIGVAAGSKDGMLAGFSSRGISKDERLSDNDPANDNEAPTITAPGTGRFFAGSQAEYGFSADIQSVRAVTGLTNALNLGDTEVPTQYLPFYTSESGTSMATPFIAGTVALMLDADPSLTPDQIKQILQSTATRMPGYSEFEVGAGYVNAYAAVDKVFHRSKGYQNFSDPTFNATFADVRAPEQDFTINYDPSQSGATSVNSHEFTVDAGQSVLDVWAQVDTVAAQGTGNLVGMAIYDPSGARYGDASIPLPVEGSDVREAVINNPAQGTWRVEFRGASSLSAVPGAASPQQLAAPGTANVKVTQIKHILPGIPDIDGDPLHDQIVFALTNRLIDTYPDGTFRPGQKVTREDLARSLMLDAPMRQSIGNTPKFADVSGDLARIAEAITASGSTFRDVGFTSTPLMTSSGTGFNPSAAATRLDLAVAFVKALGHDAKAKALAGTDVTVNGTVLTDNGQIPTELRGYVQIAINDGLFEAFPAEIREIGPGQFQAVPGPRFEPGTAVTRATLAAKLGAFNTLFWTGG